MKPEIMKFLYKKWFDNLNCGQIEEAMHAELNKFYVFGQYFKDGKPQSTYELFKYSLEEATQHLDVTIATRDHWD